MPEDSPATSRRLLEDVLTGWRSALHRVEDEAALGGELLRAELDGADADEVYENARARVAEISEAGQCALESVQLLLRSVDELHAEWRAARRYDPAVLARRLHDLGTAVDADPVRAGEEWLHEICDALDALKWPAAQGIATAEIGWPATMAAGARCVAEGVDRWSDGDDGAGRELMETIAEQRLEGWSSVLGPQLRSRAHRLAAWVCLRRLRDSGAAERHMTSAIELFPYAGRMHAERAAYYLSVGQLALAVTDAQRAVELATDDAAGYVELGIWAELSGDFDDADELYRKALRLLPTFEVARLHTGAALMDPPGRLLVAAAEVLLKKQRPAEALEVAERALHADLRGSELHPQAAVHRLRSHALEALDDRPNVQAAEAAAEAGKLYIWNGDLPAAIEQLERAIALDGGSDEVGWLLADALLTTSLPLASPLPDQLAVAKARNVWQQWAEKVGLPSGDTSWAYLTRAMIADLATQDPATARLPGVWEALMYVEKAIVHDDVDAQRWGHAAQYLRYVDLRELAFEAAEIGYRLGAADRQVLVERMTFLVNRGRLAEAEVVGEQLVSMFGNDPWVNAARAWLALRSERPGRHREALALLDLPLATGNDPSWYYEIRAQCHAGLGDVDAAREDMRQLLEHATPFDGTTKCRLAAAAIVLGDRAGARRWHEAARADPTARVTSCFAAEAFAKLAENELEDARELLASAVGRASSAVELADIVELMRVRIAMLDGTDEERAAREQALEGLQEGPIAKRVQWLERHARTPDEEMEDALAQQFADLGSPGVIRTTLLAVRARRHMQAGRFADAVEAYDELIGSGFEPEATYGLTRSLEKLAAERVVAGAVDEVKRLYDRLNALGSASPGEIAIAVSSALERSGRAAEARAEVERVIEQARDDAERQELHQRAGGLALAEHDLPAAARHFTTALENARAREDAAGVGQAEIRLALLGVLKGDETAVASHILAAVRAWRSAGAVEPGAVLMSELRGLIERPRQGSWSLAARDVLRLVERAMEAEQMRLKLPATIEALRREIGAASAEH